MAQVDLLVGGFTYMVSCRDGEEDHLRALGQSLNEKIAQARAAVGNPGEVRQLLLAALLFADENKDLRANSQNSPSPAPTNQVDDDNPALLALVERMERLASSLENSAT
jgi:cell division protein ZapA